jgi:hypothetical protein
MVDTSISRAFFVCGMHAKIVSPWLHRQFFSGILLIYQLLIYSKKCDMISIFCIL